MAHGHWKAWIRGQPISRRFPWQQGDKIRMIDDYSISGVNDSCTLNSKLDLHVVDAFVTTIKAFFQAMTPVGRETLLLAKTYDLKSAYRPLPVLRNHLKVAYFCIYNPEKKVVEIYRSRTLPFGATHSVFSFLRLARMIHCIATRGAKLITTNFYDDFILASPPALQDSARNSMELIVMLTGWEFATEGRKATDFAEVCNALGVSFDLRDACNGVLKVQQTQKRIDELVDFLTQVRERRLDRNETLKLRGRLGFADGFLHGRLGALTMKRLIDHAYGSTSYMMNQWSASWGGWSSACKLQVPRRLTLAQCVSGVSSLTLPMNLMRRKLDLAGWIPQVTALRGLGCILIETHATFWELM